MSTLEAFMFAVKEGDVVLIQDLAATTNLDAQFEQFGTPLMLATATQQHSVVGLSRYGQSSPHPRHGPTLMICTAYRGLQWSIGYRSGSVRCESTIGGSRQPGLDVLSMFSIRRGKSGDHAVTSGCGRTWMRSTT